MLRLFRMILSILSLYVLSFSSSANVHEMDDFFSMSPEELANISVSIASGTAKPAYQSASVTTVITAEQIKAMGATELPQVLETVPGLHVSFQQVTNDPVYSMRGLRNELNNQVLILLDGTRLTTPYKGSPMQSMEIPVEAIQQIEVIRGPGSALYGADAFAGVINIITKKAKDIEGTEIGLRGGSWDTQSIWGLHGDKWAGWDVAASIQYAHNNNDEDRIIQQDSLSVAGSPASLAPGEMQTKLERWNAHLNLHRKYMDIGFRAYNGVDGGFRAGTGGALDEEGSVDSLLYLTDLRFSTEDLIDDWEILTHASFLYTEIDADLHIFPDGTQLLIDGNGNINPAVMTLTSFPDGVLARVSVENQVASFEMSSIYKGFDNHLLRLNTGFRYEQVDTREKRNFGAGILNGTQAIVDGTLTDVTDSSLVFLPDSNRRIWSVTVQDEWQIHPDWHLTAGLRYDHYSDFGSTINPRFALVWEINEQLSSKLLYGRAFRAPSFLEQKQQNSQLFIGNPSLDPETINTVELAFDYRPYNNLRTAINFYFYEIEDNISVMATGNNIPTASNMAGQTGYGTEFEWDWKFHQQWNLKGNYAWQYSRVKGVNRRVDGVPEHQVYVALAWQFLPQWQLQTQLNWIGNRLSPVNDDNISTPVVGDSRILKDYETVDITLNSQQFFGYIDFSTSVRNVFDSNGREPAVAAFPDSLPIASRSFYLETTLHF